MTQPRNGKGMNFIARAFSTAILCLCAVLLYGIHPVDAVDASRSNLEKSGPVQESPDTSSTGASASISKTVSLNEQERAWLRDHPVISVVQDPELAAHRVHKYPRKTLRHVRRLPENRRKTPGNYVSSVLNLSWQEAYVRLKRHEIDMTTCVTVTPERTKFWASQNLT